MPAPLPQEEVIRRNEVIRASSSTQEAADRLGLTLKTVERWKARRQRDHVFSRRRQRCPRRSSVTLTYSSWKAMLRRCDSDHPCFARFYRDKGITVCVRWRSFEAFLADMGERPSADHSIDRIENNGNYEPGNCRWATIQQQVENRSVTRWLTLNGVTQTMAAWARQYGMDSATLRGRLKSGQELELALTTPVRPRGASPAPHSSADAPTPVQSADSPAATPPSITQVAAGNPSADATLSQRGGAA